MAEDLHRKALIETARLELARAHRGALAMNAAEMRLGLELAIAALREGSSVPIAKGEQPSKSLSDLAEALEEALGDLDDGSLPEMENLIEDVRKELDA